MFTYIAYTICLSVQQFAIHLYRSLINVKQIIFNIATIHLPWVWIVTNLPRLIATQYPRNVCLLKFSSDRCAEIFVRFGSPFPIGMPMQKSYLIPRHNGSSNMQENTSVFLGSIQVHKRDPPIWAKSGESLIEGEFVV